MKLFTCASLVLGATSVLSADIIMDQIGPDDGTGVGTNISGCQDFEVAFDIYDINTMDNFTGSGEVINMVEMVLNGWNGFVDPSSVIGYTSNLHSAPSAAALDLIGDIASSYADAADATISATWLGIGFNVMMPADMASAPGDNWVSMVPSNDFATGGQTGTADCLPALGDGVLGWQANPGGGFAMPDNYQAMTNEAAYRLMSDTVADPCNSSLPEMCTADVDGDMIVAVSDILAIVGNWGTCGDGTYRPVGDIAPMPNGDCCVNVIDLLAVIGAWGTDCTPRGACCSDVGMCTDELTIEECAATGGQYLGDSSACADGGCLSGACCMDAMTCLEVSSWYCIDSGGIFRGDGTACADISCSAECDAIGCQLPDLEGHGAGGTIGATSDLNEGAGYVVADTFNPTTSGLVTQACWWGMYIDFGAGADCGFDGPGTGDSFTINYYLDDGDSTTPGTLLAGPFEVSASVLPTGDVIPSGIGDITQYKYTADHPAVQVESGECYWISIVNHTTGSCFWLWETAPQGDGRSAQDNGGWGTSDFDVAFCVDIETNLDACGVFTGPCCLAGNVCEVLSSLDCITAEGEYKGDNLTCADVNDCQPIPGACCFPDSCIQNTTDEECLAFGGKFMGEDTTCLDVDCTPNPYDQIGASDGSSLDGNITASQIFEAANTAYDVATIDDFTFDAQTTVTSIETVISGWNGYVGLDGVTNFTINVYSSPEAAGADLVGDVYSIDIVEATLLEWSGDGDLVSFEINLVLPAGTYYFAVVPWNEFGTNGQTGIAGSTLGDGLFYQANPNGGFGFGAWQESAGNAGYRLGIQ